MFVFLGIISLCILGNSRLCHNLATFYRNCSIKQFTAAFICIKLNYIVNAPQVNKRCYIKNNLSLSIEIKLPVGDCFHCYIRYITTLTLQYRFGFGWNIPLYM